MQALRQKLIVRFDVSFQLRRLLVCQASVFLKLLSFFCLLLDMLHNISCVSINTRGFHHLTNSTTVGNRRTGTNDTCLTNAGPEIGITIFLPGILALINAFQRRVCHFGKHLLHALTDSICGNTF